MQLALDVGALAVRSSQIFQITWTAHTGAKVCLAHDSTESFLRPEHQPRIDRAARGAQEAVRGARGAGAQAERAATAEIAETDAGGNAEG